MFEEFEQLHAHKSFLINKYNFICSDNEKNQKLLEEKKNELDIMNKSSIVISKAVEDTFKYLEMNITDIANKALATVFDEPYELSFIVGTRGKKTRTNTVGIELKKNGVRISKNLTQAVEGGQRAVLSVVLRTAFLMLKEDARKILLLDECFSAISRIEENDGNSNLKRAFKMIEKLSETFGFQCILVSHCLENKS